MLFDFVQTHHALGHSLQTQVGQARSKIALFLLGPPFSSLIFPPRPTLVWFVEVLVFVSPRLAVTELLLVVPAPVFISESRLRKVVFPPGGVLPRIVLVLSLMVKSSFSSVSSLLLMIATTAVV